MSPNTQNVHYELSSTVFIEWLSFSSVTTVQICEMNKSKCQEHMSVSIKLIVQLSTDSLKTNDTWSHEANNGVGRTIENSNTREEAAITGSGLWY